MTLSLLVSLYLPFDDSDVLLFRQDFIDVVLDIRMVLDELGTNALDHCTLGLDDTADIFLLVESKY